MASFPIFGTGGLWKAASGTGTPADPFVPAVNVAGGSGSVTSVGMTGDGTIFDATVTGSPVTDSGTLVPALLTHSANTVLAGPTTGVAVAPTFRALVAADLTAWTPAGGPTQSANLILAGPATGSALAPTFRALVAKDIPALPLTIATALTGAGALTVNEDNPIDTSGGAFAVTYANPSTWAGQFILIRDAGASWGVTGDNLTITCYSGTKLAGLTNTDLICNLNGGMLSLYSDGTNVWANGNFRLPPQRLVSGAAGAVVLSDCGPAGQGGTILMLDNSTPRNLVLPANGTIPVPIGYEVYCIQQGSAQVTWTVTSDSLNGSGGLVASKGQWAVTGARKDTATHWVIFGDRA